MALVRVLVVDDVAHVRHDLITLLTLDSGIQVVGEACNGLDAVRQCNLLHPDVVLMDLVMPALDGYAATRGIKARHPAIRVVAYSVYGDDESRRRALKAGVDSFVLKGASLDVLLQAIRSSAGNVP